MMSTQKHVEIEILNTERSFYNGLVDLEKYYMVPIAESIQKQPKNNITEKEYQSMFARISVIQGVSQQLLSALQLYINNENNEKENTTTTTTTIGHFIHFL
jgi:hypothetical protein